MNLCSVEDCGSRAIAKGLCGKHYQRQLNTGSTEKRPRLVDELCSCRKRLAQYKTANGQPLDHPLCQPCYRRAQREQRVEPVELICARPACAKPFTVLRDRTKDQPNFKKYCSRKCKDQAKTEDGRQAEIAQRSYYKTRYGLTPEQVEQMRTTGICEICGTAGFTNGRWGNLHIDHCHETGRVRGVLCSECNNGLGKFHDDPVLLRKAIEYLARAGVVA